jgi:hypothetical protein
MWVYLFYIEFCGASHIEGLIPLNAGIMGGRVSLNRQSSTGIASAQERHLAQSHNPFLDSPYPMNSYKILKKPSQFQDSLWHWQRPFWRV